MNTSNNNNNMKQKIEKYRKQNLPDLDTYEFMEDELEDIMLTAFSEGLYQALKAKERNENVDLDVLFNNFWKNISQ